MEHEVETLKPPKGVLVVERRKHPRLDVELSLDYSPIVDREDIGGRVANVTEGGVQVYLPEKLEVGDLFKIRIFAPGESEVNSVEAIAKVVWADPEPSSRPGQYRYGLQLQSFYRKDLDKFRILLKEIEGNPDE
jgi:c-di-GMP-binding flagellar brake protein YcgR